MGCAVAAVGGLALAGDRFIGKTKGERDPLARC